ncbi:Isoprenylcysteine carboxyl methyltransferase [Gloeothece citriformis PCC 7424]|uniref:Isoprenylcysteine carboxyl methyltransferase n=1 Tax=Gloeothece citriformis (strain PCC 7424) TaxID=65393 RepID=B7K7U8_GLOC7|nr:isoprenylcysteine carboxylmethyltransferase family protein [Gloeothece citriformis]ACK71144.1 Isoprenylcysteine carboxyl methyltransferase [Gloeothece citriformis PCC 7424]
MLTKAIFLGIIILVILQRLIELKISKDHAADILAQGGQQHSDNLLSVVKLMQISWWIAMIAEVWYFNRPWIPTLAFISLVGLIGGQSLRYLSMQALGWRWTLSIMTVPSLSVVNGGVYQYLRHPNWLGVILEIFFLPLIQGAFITAITFSLLNAVVMSQRIQAEEKALMETTNYATVMAEKPRFIPNLAQLASSLISNNLNP